MSCCLMVLQQRLEQISPPVAAHQKCHLQRSSRFEMQYEIPDLNDLPPLQRIQSSAIFRSNESKKRICSIAMILVIDLLIALNTRQVAGPLLSMLRVRWLLSLDSAAVCQSHCAVCQCYIAKGSSRRHDCYKGNRKNAFEASTKRHNCIRVILRCEHETVYPLRIFQAGVFCCITIVFRGLSGGTRKFKKRRNIVYKPCSTKTHDYYANLVCNPSSSCGNVIQQWLFVDIDRHSTSLMGHFLGYSEKISSNPESAKADQLRFSIPLMFYFEKGFRLIRHYKYHLRTAEAGENYRMNSYCPNSRLAKQIDPDHQGHELLGIHFLGSKRTCLGCLAVGFGKNRHSALEKMVAAQARCYCSQAERGNLFRAMRFRPSKHICIPYIYTASLQHVPIPSFGSCLFSAAPARSSMCINQLPSNSSSCADFSPVNTCCREGVAASSPIRFRMLPPTMSVLLPAQPTHEQLSRAQVKVFWTTFFCLQSRAVNARKQRRGLNSCDCLNCTTSPIKAAAASACISRPMGIAILVNSLNLSVSLQLIHQESKVSIAQPISAHTACRSLLSKELRPHRMAFCTCLFPFSWSRGCLMIGSFGYNGCLPFMSRSRARCRTTATWFQLQRCLLAKGLSPVRQEPEVADEELSLCGI
eukprot:284817977_4